MASLRSGTRKDGSTYVQGQTVQTDPELLTLTVGDWLEHHIERLIGVRKSTLYDYRAYAKNDIVPTLGELPLMVLSRDDIAR
jgi:hypothetical protein